MARPTKLTPHIQAKVVLAIRGGNYAEIAARLAGIDEATYYRWMARGKAEEDRLAERSSRKMRETERPFCEFRKAVMEADAAAEAQAAAAIMVAGKKDWKAHAWLLERRHPDRWRRRTDAIVHHEGPTPGGGPVQAAVAVHQAPEQGVDQVEVARAAHDFLRAAGVKPAAALDA